MSLSSKKFVPLSAYDRSRLISEHAMRSQSSKKVLDASNHIPSSNPEPTNILDRQTVPDESMLVTRNEG